MSFFEQNNDSDKLHSLRVSDDNKPTHLDFNEDVGMFDPQLCVKMKFSNHVVFKNTLKEWALKEDLIINSQKKKKKEIGL